MNNKCKKIYAVYKGEKFLCEGTAIECANYIGVKANTIRWWNTKANKKRALGKRKNGIDKKRKLAIVINEED